jgi:hypothetical protein
VVVLVLPVGLEWLSAEKSMSTIPSVLRWGPKENIIPDITKLHNLLKIHPCFFDGAKLIRLSRLIHLFLLC